MPYRLLRRCSFRPHRMSAVVVERLSLCNSSTMFSEHVRFDGSRSGSVSRHKIVDELFVPILENEQRPYLLKSGILSFFLQSNNRVNSLRIKKFSTGGIAGKQCVVNKVSELKSEPR